jgi:hypothetical protein
VIIYLFPKRGKHTHIFIRHCFLAFLKKKVRNDFSMYFLPILGGGGRAPGSPPLNPPLVCGPQTPRLLTPPNHKSWIRPFIYFLSEGNTQIFIRHCFLAFLKKKVRNDFSMYTFFCRLFAVPRPLAYSRPLTTNPGSAPDVSM